MIKNYTEKFQTVKVDFRDRLKAKFSPFVMEANQFIAAAVEHLITGRDSDELGYLALKITNDWLDALNMRDVVDLGLMPSKAEMASYTGMSLEEVLLLEATAYAEALGLDITPLEKSAAEHKIYGAHFPGRMENDIPSYPYRDDLNGDPAL